MTFELGVAELERVRDVRRKKKDQDAKAASAIKDGGANEAESQSSSTATSPENHPGALPYQGESEADDTTKLVSDMEGVNLGERAKGKLPAATETNAEHNNGAPAEAKSTGDVSGPAEFAPSQQWVSALFCLASTDFP
jgi:hypothetical protein